MTRLDTLDDSGRPVLVGTFADEKTVIFGKAEFTSGVTLVD